MKGHVHRTRALKKDTPISETKQVTKRNTAHSVAQLRTCIPSSHFAVRRRHEEVQVEALRMGTIFRHTLESHGNVSARVGASSKRPAGWVYLCGRTLHYVVFCSAGHPGRFDVDLNSDVVGGGTD